MKKQPASPGDGIDESDTAARLERAEREIERLNEELAEFAYRASHDLKQPVRGIQTYCRFILEDLGDSLPEEGRNQLLRMQRLAEHLSALIEALLRYSRLGQVELAREGTDLNELLQDVLRALRFDLEREGVDVRVPEPLPSVHCDAGQVYEVLLQLLANAVKYNDGPEKWVEVGVADDATVYVRDNGIGIREQHQEVVFRIFRRLHPPDRYGGGTGAGMAIVQRIVERHGGRVWVESTPGEGTTVHFNLGDGGASDGKTEE